MRCILRSILLYVVVGLVAATPALASSNEIVVGNVRVQALSRTLIHLEPKGPLGFEDRPTLMVRNRSFPSSAALAITVDNDTATATWLRTAHYLIRLPKLNCSAMLKSTDGKARVNTQANPDGLNLSSADACCAACGIDISCRGFVFRSAPAPRLERLSGKHTDKKPRENNCELLADWNGTEDRGGYSLCESEPVAVFSLGSSNAGTSSNGGQRSRGHSEDVATLVWSGSVGVASNTMHWPSPSSGTRALAISDRPRIVTPVWGPEPIPESATVDPALRSSNGYDFRNLVDGDLYIFILRPSSRENSSLVASSSSLFWWEARGDYLRLTGPTPLLPDWAYGTWYTWWYPYTEEAAKAEIMEWREGQFPLDVWGLDMNWRNVTGSAGGKSCKTQENDSPLCEDHFYNHSNTRLFPDWQEWFSFLAKESVKTYFNDHPYPVDEQTTPAEISFRWKGLTNWLKRGLTFWWFDHNWAFSIPAPMESKLSHNDWQGLTGAVPPALRVPVRPTTTAELLELNGELHRSTQ